MPTPITVTANFDDILGNANVAGSVKVQLCNYGGQIPRISGTAILANTSPTNIAVVAGAPLSFNVWGNDIIIPGPNLTYYTVAVLDTDNNVIQVNAYQFTGAGPYDLSSATPYNPNVVVVGGVTVFGQLVTVPYASPLALDGSLGTAFDIGPLTGDVTSSTLTNVQAGSIYTFIITQDAVGGRAFSWPSNVKNGMPPDTTANAISVQSFIARANGNLYPIGPMTVN